MIELFRPDRCQQAQETEESRTEQAEQKNGPAMDRRHMHIRPDQHGQPDGKANADRPRYGRSDHGSHEFNHGYGRHQIVDKRSLYYAKSEEHTYELTSLMRTSYAVFCLKKNI